MNKFWTWVVVIAVILIIVGASSGNDSNHTSNSSSYGKSPDTPIISGSKNLKTIDRQDAIDEYWDDIKGYLNGTETINACSTNSGNCYDLEADISNGSIDRVDFESGGYLNFSADIDSDGSASDVDENGNNWDFTLDMDSSLVDDAVNQWADANGYTIQ